MLKLSRKNISLLAVVSTLIMVWSSIPNWVGYASQNQHAAFTGSYFDAYDYAVHIAMLRSGMQGAWGYTLRFTSEPQRIAYVRMFYIILGEFNRLLDANPEMLFQIARWVFGYTTLLSIYLLSRRCFGGEAARLAWLAFFLAVFGSGLGWLQRIFGWVPGPLLPIDFWLIDGYVFFSLSLFPHFAFTLTLICLAYLWYLDYLQDGKWLRIGAIIVAAILVQWVNPIAFVVVDAALTTATFVHWMKRRPVASRTWMGLGAIALAQIPLLVYSFSILSRDPVWSQFTIQNETLSPPPIYYLWGFGLFWPPALLGSIHALRSRNTILLASLAWVVLAFALAYSPFPIQRRFLLGVTIPLSLLATRGLADIFRFISHRNAWLSRRVPALALLTVLCISMTSFIFGPIQIRYMAQQYMSRQPQAFFYPRSLDTAFDWINANTQPDDLIFSSVHTGQLLAQKTGRRVFLGHGMETLNYAEKKQEFDSYLAGELPLDRLLPYPVGWLVYGPYEQEIAPGFVPGPDLKLVFQSESVKIYEIGVHP